MALVLFDPSSIFSYVLVIFDLGLNIVYDMIDAPVNISIFVGDSIIVTRVYVLVQ